MFVVNFHTAFIPSHDALASTSGRGDRRGDNRLVLVRLLGASAAWFLMDFAYYGNTVSSPLVLSTLRSNHTLLEKTLTQLGIFAAFAAPGYAVAALTMDKLGRKISSASVLQ